MSSIDTQYVINRYKEPAEESGFRAKRLAKIRSLLPSQGTLLEMGALNGSTVKYYKEKFKGKTYGIDISMELLKGAEKIIDEVKVCDLSKESIPWDNESFDVVICSEVIEHIYDTDKLLQDIHRVLKPDGTLIISTPNLSSFINRIFILFGYQPIATEVSATISNYGNPFRKKLAPAGHIRDFTYRAFHDIVVANGFAIEATYAVPLIEKPIAVIFDSFFSKFFPSLGSNPILKAKKIT